MEIIISILLIIVIVIQVYHIFFSVKSNDGHLIKELGEFKLSISELLSSRFSDILKENRENEKNTRDGIQGFFKSAEEGLSKSFDSLSNNLSEKISDFSKITTEKLTTVTTNIESMTQKVDTKLQSIQKDNNEQLEKMRNTVDEKLQNTLEKRLGESFKLVSERLEQVHKGLGEMQSLATGVGDLKKVLSNVKTRGTLGEIQLENILEQILSPEQYDKNVKTKKESNAVVEFAIKLPGKEEDHCVYIPVDAKFPLEKYHHLIDAYNDGNSDEIKNKSKELETAVVLSAKAIRDKYIDVPHTTDFGIMFFPIEGLYAEVVRSPGLLERIQKDLKIMIAGPTTLVAMLNSLQMGINQLRRPESPTSRVGVFLRTKQG